MNNAEKSRLSLEFHLNDYKAGSLVMPESFVSIVNNQVGYKLSCNASLPFPKLLKTVSNYGTKNIKWVVNKNTLFINDKNKV